MPFIDAPAKILLTGVLCPLCPRQSTSTHLFHCNVKVPMATLQLMQSKTCLSAATQVVLYDKPHLLSCLTFLLVVGTVRSEKKGEELAKLYTQYPGRFSYAIVPDIVKVSNSRSGCSRY